MGNNKLKYGRVVGTFTRFVADGPDDGSAPDELTLNGTVTFVPSVKSMRWPNLEVPTISLIEEIVCPVLDGELYPPESDSEPGVWLVASEQPDAVPDYLSWTATFKFPGSPLAAVTFEVVAGETINLATVLPAGKQAGTERVVVYRTVPSEQAEINELAQITADLRELLLADLSVDAKGVKSVDGILPDETGNVKTRQVNLTRAAFDLIAEPDPNILYFITD